MSDHVLSEIGGLGLFEGTQKVPIKPITLIFGPNGGGKTSLINSFISAQPEYHIPHLRPSRSMNSVIQRRLVYDYEYSFKDFNLYLNLLEIPYELVYDYESPFRDKRTGTKTRHQDMGTGISQLLPVITSACTSQDQIVVIEHPEANLHPVFQVGLGDMFMESALGERGNTFILETHSEHLILRLLRRIRETTATRNGDKQIDNTVEELPPGLLPITPDDIAVIYANSGAKGTKLTSLRVTEDGSFVGKWPHGFFTERGRELF